MNFPPVDIYRSAKVCLSEYGDGAYMHAVDRAGQLQAKGDEAGAATWLAISDAILDLEGKAPRGTTH